MLTRAAAAFACFLAASGLAAAQPDDVAQKKAAAEAAFRQGKDLINADVAAACAAFKQSMELDPQFGTQYNLALCYEKLGKLASAWGELTELAAKDTNTARRADAAARAKALEPRLVRLLIVVKQRVSGMKIRRDESDVTAFMGVSTPVDPGTSKLTSTAPGYKPWSLDVTLSGEGTTITVEVPPLEKAPEPEQKPPGDDRKDVFRAPTPPRPPRDPGAGRRIGGIALTAVGAGGLVAGVIFGMSARSSYADAEEECGGDVTDCRGDHAIAADHIDDARASALWSTIGFGAGAAMIVGGAVLYFTAPTAAKPESRPSITPVLSETSASLFFSGRF